MDVFANSEIRNGAAAMSHTHSHNRMPFSNPLRKSLSPKLFPVTAWGQRTGRDRCKGSVLGLRLQIKTVLITH